MEQGIFERLAGNFQQRAGNFANVISDGKHRWTGPQSARWDRGRRWANLLIAAKPECFRPAGRCVKPPERGRFLLREPDAALLLGPRIRQRLGEGR